MTSAADDATVRFLNKVPQVTAYFWIIKVLATTVGETGADFLSTNLGFGLTGTSWIVGSVLMVFLLIQILARKYIPWAYWTAVVLISVAGTLITDNLVDHFGVSLETTTAVFSLALLATFFVWHSIERTLSIQSIVTTRRELFYWLAILFTFALGTAAGDLAAEGLGLGYPIATLVFGGAIALTTAAYYGLKTNAVLSFWVVYILTRPLGASIGDLLSQARQDGGLGFGTVATSGVFLVVIVGLVAFLTITKKDVVDESPT